MFTEVVTQLKLSTLTELMNYMRPLQKTPQGSFRRGNLLIVNGGSFERIGLSFISYFNGSYDNKKSDEGDVNMNVRNVKLYVGVIVLLICVWLIIVPRLKLYVAKRNAHTLIENRVVS